MGCLLWCLSKSKRPLCLNSYMRGVSSCTKEDLSIPFQVIFQHLHISHGPEFQGHVRCPHLPLNAINRLLLKKYSTRWCHTSWEKGHFRSWLGQSNPNSGYFSSQDIHKHQRLQNICFYKCKEWKPGLTIQKWTQVFLKLCTSARLKPLPRRQNTVTSKAPWSSDFASAPQDCLQEGKWSSTSPAEAVEEFKAARK